VRTAAPVIDKWCSLAASLAAASATSRSVRARSAVRCSGRRRQVGPRDAGWPVHSSGNTAREGWSWPYSWANLAALSPSPRPAPRGSATRGRRRRRSPRGWLRCPARPPTPPPLGMPRTWGGTSRSARAPHQALVRQCTGTSRSARGWAVCRSRPGDRVRMRSNTGGNRTASLAERGVASPCIARVRRRHLGPGF
jgi:hypothetical protein